MPARRLVSQILALAALVACRAPPSALEAAADRLVPAAPARAWSRVEVPERAAPAIDVGWRAFGRYCAPCHGTAADGKGELARFLRVPPRDLRSGNFELRSTAPDSPPADSDLFRTLTAGIPASGMPAFAHLSAKMRWALVDYVKSLSPSPEPPRPVDLREEPALPSGEGARLYVTAGCVACHGARGRGDGPSAKGLRPAPADWTLGPAVFKAGASPRDVFRTLLTGMPGSAMPSYETSGLSRRDLWAIARHVSDLSRGRGRWVARWRDFLGSLDLGPAPAPVIKDAEMKPTRPKDDGCLRCHRGIEPINDKMQWVADALAGSRPGASCAICHGGAPDGATKGEAHAGMIANPGSLWAVGLGQGCARCHAAAGSLTTFQGIPLPRPMGGDLMTVVSSVDDPTGATGGDQAYRVPRGLMAAELGKATNTLAANGLAPKGQAAFADVVVDDPDGPVPVAGSPAYHEWVRRAMAEGFLRHVDRADVIPGAAAGLPRFGSLPRAAVGDMFRKDCARCHLWDRGRPGAGGRWRSEGCSACHVLYGVDGLSHSTDPTLAGEGPGHPLQHRITARVPSSQCAHCHWQGGGYYDDLHYQRGLECQDCHDSIDVHGDGNVYPTMHLQVSVACEDCHGTPRAYPWELPVGYGTPVTLDGPRGVVRVAGADHLLSSRGNAEARWIRRGDEAILQGLDGREHAIPLLKNLHLSGGWKSEVARVAMDAIPAHEGKLECVACHIPRIVQCQGCHVEADFRGRSIDWVASLRARASPFSAAGRVATPGEESFHPSPHALVEPTLGVDAQGRVTGLVPGDFLSLRAIDLDGGVSFLGPHRTSEGLPSLSLAPLIPHEVSLASRSCESCHAAPQAVGYGIGHGRDEPMEPAPVAERVPTLEQVNALEVAEEGGGPQPDRSAAEHQEQLLRRFDALRAHRPLPPEPAMFSPAGEPARPQRGAEAAVLRHAGGGTRGLERFDVDRLVTRGGLQVKNLVDPGERPLSGGERAATEREGACLACHKLAGTPGWTEVVRRLGRARTPEEHDRVVSALLEKFLKKK